jgi:two-component system OmpR family sensor kinase
MIQSFRWRLTARFTAIMAAVLSVVAVLSWLAIRESLDRELNANLLNVASIQAASVTDAPSGAMHFHEWELTPEEAAQIRDLNRYAEIWNARGESLLRTRYITHDLPLDTAVLHRVVDAGKVVRTEQRFQGMPIRSLYYPLGRLGPLHALHVLQVAAPLDARDRLLRRLALMLTLLVVGATLATLAGSWWLAERAVRPIHQIIDQAEAIEAGSLDRGIRASADSREYHRLVAVLNGMLGRLRSAFDAQRRFTADASHELRSPLTALRGELELARRRERSPDEYRRVIDSSLEEVDRLSRMAEDLLTLARSDAGVMQPRFDRGDLADCVTQAVDRLRGAASSGQVELAVQARGDTHGCFDADLLKRLVWNLVDNAVRMTPAGGRVEVRVGRTDGRVMLEVLDTGPGIPDDQTEHIFDRFVRLDESRTPEPAAGTGLGLAIVRSIARAHHGEVWVENRPEGGACFRVELPADNAGQEVTGESPGVTR